MNRLAWLRDMDWSLPAAVAGLVTIGIAAIAAATDSQATAGPAERQFVWTGISLIAMVLVAWPHYGVIERHGYLLFAVCVPLLLAVLWTNPINGAQRWLRFGPVGVQPSELAKIAYIAAVARFLSRRDGLERPAMLLVPLALAAIPMLLILKQPDLGTALLFPPIVLAMCAGTNIRTRYFVIFGLAGLFALPVLWRFMSTTQRTRVTGFISQRDTGPRPRDDGYQLYQSKLMIALGGPAGSDEATEVHLPFDHTDFVFSVIAGRWGLAGVSITVTLFAFVIWRGLRIASASIDQFGRLMAIGLVTLLAAQGTINMAMTVGFAPVTGLTLPFVSYGGSSLVASFIAVGILMSISRQQADEWP